MTRGTSPSTEYGPFLITTIRLLLTVLLATIYDEPGNCGFGLIVITGDEHIERRAPHMPLGQQVRRKWR
jgi:hypothetical protein